jgi:hydroxypyruvate isomerase
MRPDVNLSILFSELPLLERSSAAAACGIDVVELWWPFESPEPGDLALDGLAKALRDAGVQLVGLNFDAGDMAGGDRRLVSLPGEGQRLRENIDVVITFAAGVGFRALNAFYGNRVTGIDPGLQDELAVEEVALGPGGILAHARPGSLYITGSTVSNTSASPRPSAARRDA